MGSNIIELAKLGHERAAELKASCGAVDVRSLAQLISDLATQLEVQFVRSTNMAVQLANAESKCRELAAENGRCKFEISRCHQTIDEMFKHRDKWVDKEWLSAIWSTSKRLMNETQATDAFLAEARAQGVEMLLSSLPPHYTARADIERFAAQLRKGAAHHCSHCGAIDTCSEHGCTATDQMIERYRASKGATL